MAQTTEFLSLPTELRLEIFTQLLQDCAIKPVNVAPTRISETKQYMSLFWVNKRIREEAEDVFYRLLSLYVEIDAWSMKGHVGDLFFTFYPRSKHRLPLDLGRFRTSTVLVYATIRIPKWRWQSFRLWPRESEMARCAKMFRSLKALRTFSVVMCSSGFIGYYHKGWKDDILETLDRRVKPFRALNCTETLNTVDVTMIKEQLSRPGGPILRADWDWTNNWGPVVRYDFDTDWRTRGDDRPSWKGVLSKSSLLYQQQRLWQKICDALGKDGREQLTSGLQENSS